jgi:cellulose synthase/poly-beta-1,6-N-acetylglucosamine synthase-like glycosyltransferase/peptidoglycan/xylan/chitin deacetylase (PgdA/CDA1 family)
VPDKVVALTFDDGPDPKWTPKVLDVLDRHGVKGTFFVIGSHVLAHKGVVQRAYREGHELGNHTFTHVDLLRTPAWRATAELRLTEAAIASATGHHALLMRPPYSSRPAAVGRDTLRTWERDIGGNYLVVLSTLDSEDWKKSTTVDEIAAAATPNGAEGGIVLMHDGGGDRKRTIEALDRLIPQLQGRGFRFATISELANMSRATAMPPASTSERLRSYALSGSLRVSSWVTSAFTVFAILVAILAVLRTVFLLAFARRHARGIAAIDPSFAPFVSIVVPAYNEAAGIAAALRSLAASLYPSFEVLVVDDGSTDDTAAIVYAVIEEDGLTNVQLIRRVNGGKAAALNTGIEHARGDIVVTVDGDTVFEPQTVGLLVQRFRDPRVGAVSGNTKVANRRRLLGRWQHIEYVMGFNLDRRLYDVLGCMSTVPGAVGAFRRQALEQVGGVSDDTLAEDTDLTVAVVRAGWRVVYREDARAWTEAPSSWGQLWRQRYRWCYGTLQAMWKHRRALVERGPSGRYGRRGLAFNLLFQVLLPLTAPAMDLYLIFGLLTGEAGRALLLWLVMLGMQLLGAVYAFRLDGERLAPLWALPLQQLAYRQLMYLVVVNSVFTALYGLRLPWVKLRRTGEVGMPGSASAPSAPSSSGGSRVGGPG